MPIPKKKPEITHRIGHCANCGWVHKEIRRVRISEGKNAIIKALCIDCIKEQPVHVLCDLCGRTKCDNLYPVTVMRKRLDKPTDGGNFPVGNTCNLFLHLCAECRTISHIDLLRRLQLPENICDTCKDRFVCFTVKSAEPINSQTSSAVVNNQRTKIEKRYGTRKSLFGNLFRS